MSKNTECYCVGFHWYGNETENQLPRFQKEGIWENGFEDKYIEKVKNVPIGSRLAAKTSYTRKENDKTISVLQIHGLGTVTGNPKDGKILKVEWDNNFKTFTLDGRGAYRSTIDKVNNPENIELIFGSKHKEGAALAFNIEDTQEIFPLNQILFGPPGTGKTYHTINKAVSIIDRIKEGSLEKYFESRKDLKERFDELVIRDWDHAYGQIGFITFHQSMSYEDFIEGIKPQTSNEGKVTYDTEPGILKKICRLAKNNWLDANKGAKEKLSFEDAFSKLREQWEENPNMLFPLRTEGKEFTILGFTKTSIRFKKANGGTDHTLSIATLGDYYYSKKDVRQTGIGIYYPGILKKLKEFQPETVLEKEEKKYVLIIDEINRGNVSQIFGELITLIEEDKRLGKNEALEVTLPYSDELFGVPPNLYIIGTMNTADRSVEALDTALRRRFNFVEMPPRYDLEELQAEVAGFKLTDLLKTINQRIEKLLTRDNQIGHSYLLPVKNPNDLQVVFQNKIMPLLQEYFFGDYGKIGLVLGSDFVEKVETTNEKFANFEYEDGSADFAGRTVYRLKNVAKMDGDVFKQALVNLINK